MKSWSRWVVCAFTPLLLAACLGETPPGAHPYYIETCSAFGVWLEECGEHPDGYAETYARNCAEGNAGEPCDAHAPSQEQCLMEVAALPCDQGLVYPNSCADACVGGPVICDTGVRAEVGSPQCEACIGCALGWPCLVESQACDNSPACQDFLQCTDGCDDDGGVCYDACIDNHPTGSELRLELIQCIFCDECTNNCSSAESFCQ